MRPEDREESLDKKLNIHTVGRDDALEDDHHFPYEPTPYAVLELLADSGWIGEENLLLDYGCGKGRASFYLSSATGCRSIGVDFNGGFIAAAEQNRTDYRGDRSRIAFLCGVDFNEGFIAAAEQNRRDYRGDGSRIAFLCEGAERYEVPEDADRFYFFNPFSEKVLQSVIGKILESWYRRPRHLLLMFYYPSDEYIAALMNVEELDFLDEIDCSELFPGDRRERILCFEAEGVC